MMIQALLAAALLCLVVVESRYPYGDTYRPGDIVPNGQDSRQAHYPYDRKIYGSRITGGGYRDGYYGSRRSDVLGGYRGYGDDYYRRPRGLGGYNKYDDYGRYPSYRDYEYRRPVGGIYRRDYEDSRSGYGGNNNIGGYNSITGIGVRLN